MAKKSPHYNKRASEQHGERLRKLLVSKKVVDLAAMRSALGDVSVMTVFRALKDVPYRRSINHNGRFYTWHDPKHYDRLGLLSYGDVHFSIDGSLRNTVCKMVREAPSGATHRELQDRLKVRVHNTLAELLRSGQIDRERLLAVYVYLHTESTIRKAQIQKRQEQIEARSAEEEITDAVIIQVLLTLIRRPRAKPGDVVRYLHGHAPPITMAHVHTVFDRYDLEHLGEKGGPLSS